MGQYYKVLLMDENETRVLDRTIDGEYTLAKLTEHSWWENPFVNTVCRLIYKKPTKVIWMGDYASDTEQYKEKFEKDDLYSLVWNDNDDEEQGLKSNQLKLNNKYLVNHTSKEYINCKQYKKENMKEEWCLHPLPLMTAVGNGMGGGDYYGPDKDVVGVWAGDLISVEDTAPDGYTLVCVNFVE